MYSSDLKKKVIIVVMPLRSSVYDTDSTKVHKHKNVSLHNAYILNYPSRCPCNVCSHSKKTTVKLNHEHIEARFSTSHSGKIFYFMEISHFKKCRLFLITASIQSSCPLIRTQQRRPQNAIKFQRVIISERVKFIYILFIKRNTLLQSSQGKNFIWMRFAKGMCAIPGGKCIRGIIKKQHSS